MQTRCKCNDGRPCRADCGCNCHEIDHNDNTDYRKISPRPNGAEVLLMSWVQKNCKFAQTKTMTIKSSMLYGWRPKVEQTAEEIRQGLTSRTEGPLTVSKLDRIRGGWFVMDGHHRAMEMIAKGETLIPCVVDQYVPYFERPAEANANMLSDMVSLLDFAKQTKQAAYKNFSPEFMAWFGKSKIADAKGQPMVVYKGMQPYDWDKPSPDIVMERDKNGIQHQISKRPGGSPPPENEIREIGRKSEFPSFYKKDEGSFDESTGKWSIPKDEPGIQIAGFFGGIETANEFAKLYGRGAVYPAYLSIQNPYIVDAKGGPAGQIQFGESGIPFREAMRSETYDGAILLNTKDEGTVYIAKYPQQIKSAISP